ncbi:MAG: shikimate dehydrogenase [Algoriphagus sp.]|uniref:shikimate dehydrogenase family protein n=1 Tax=Algoriphagus sp. TaxID=1872435 RepID=UPI002721881F|nr:shikimate dehydrogenase [Algoriphagus sp.]MDO8966468.1 shikimate dehydrogenase [Algoriphagus sp.]MDP2040554.1 shikimate dehydrogenase [Algoriphagus sp.]MDP3201914.1 shikimate dehydrogenase [Algoriphagus sp.]MDP3473304.1 shikimate dehydrogenase [Algoriphagus sp.]
MRKFGLIGYPLTHSFSKKYFSAKFEKERIWNCEFELYEIPQIADFEKVLSENPEMEGMSVTIPYKQEVIPFLNELDSACELIGAVNCIQIRNGYRKGFNTDYIGFKNSLKNWLGKEIPRALVLGTGGASKAVKVALKDLGVSFLAVSRNPAENQITYADLKSNSDFMINFPLIINTTPLGTFPKTEEMPEIPVEMLTESHRVYDLVYNPAETTLMKACIERGGKAKNGMDMLVLQAEAAWTIWNS